MAPPNKPLVGYLARLLWFGPVWARGNYCLGGLEFELNFRSQNLPKNTQYSTAGKGNQGRGLPRAPGWRWRGSGPGSARPGRTAGRGPGCCAALPPGLADVGGGEEKCGGPVDNKKKKSKRNRKINAKRKESKSTARKRK